MTDKLTQTERQTSALQKMAEEATGIFDDKWCGDLAREVLAPPEKEQPKE